MELILLLNYEKTSTALARERVGKGITGAEWVLARNLHWLIILFLLAGFSFVWLGLPSLPLILPAACLLLRGIWLEARLSAPASGESKILLKVCKSAPKNTASGVGAAL